MLKRELFLLAMKAGEYKRKAWVISAFSLIHESQASSQQNIYPYKIIQTPTSYFFIDPLNENKIYPIDDAVPGKPLYGVAEVVKLKASDSIENLSEDITTTYGRVLFNFVAIINAFGSKIPFINGITSVSDVEKLILPRLKDNTEKVEDRNSNDIYVDEYLVFSDSMFFLAGFTQLCVPAATKKTMTPAPGIEELKAKLLEENKDRLSDPAVIAKIDAELVKYDREYLKGDLGEGFLITNEAYTKVRKKMFSMHGAESGLEDRVDMELIPNSLYQGWDMNAFPAMNNSLRAGSFNRGAETMKGGEAFKWLQRSSSNMNVTIDDCGSKLGNIVDVNEGNLDWLVGFSVITKTGHLLIETRDQAKEYIGKRVMVRSPMFCKATKTDFCHVCVGSKLSDNPTALSVAITAFGSTILNMMMKKMHGSTLALAKMDYKTAIF